MLTLGEKRNAFVCYDTELLRYSLGWVNDGKRFGLTVPKFNTPKPQVVGMPVFGTALVPGWAKDGIFSDPRKNKRGSLPENWAHHKGFYQHGRQVVLHYTVGGVELLELPDFESVEGRSVFTRTIQPLQTAVALTLSLLFVPGAELSEAEMGVNVCNPKTGHMHLVACEGGTGAEWKMHGDSLTLKLASVTANEPFRIAIASLGETNEVPPNDGLALPPVPGDLRPLTKGGPVLFHEVVTTRGERAADDAAYVVDRLTEPVKNPWNADTLFGGFDFFDDGRAAVCTPQGEVWIVSGIDAGLEKLEWRRFASGLFQTLGLKIVRGEVHVIGRDQITRLRDQNGDGEADHYANVNNDALLGGNGAEYSLDLQTDAEGNFYFGKATSYYPDIRHEHEGVIFKVSPDGAKSEVIATGLRVPNGLAVSPAGGDCRERSAGPLAALQQAQPHPPRRFLRHDARRTARDRDVMARRNPPCESQRSRRARAARFHRLWPEESHPRPLRAPARLAALDGGQLQRRTLLGCHGKMGTAERKAALHQLRLLCALRHAAAQSRRSRTTRDGAPEPAF